MPTPQAEVENPPDLKSQFLRVRLPVELLTKLAGDLDLFLQLAFQGSGSPCGQGRLATLKRLIPIVHLKVLAVSELSQVDIGLCF